MKPLIYIVIRESFTRFRKSSFFLISFLGALSISSLIIITASIKNGEVNPSKNFALIDKSNSLKIDLNSYINFVQFDSSYISRIEELLGKYDAVISVSEMIDSVHYYSYQAPKNNVIKDLNDILKDELFKSILKRICLSFIMPVV